MRNWGKRSVAGAMTLTAIGIVQMFLAPPAFAQELEIIAASVRGENASSNDVPIRHVGSLSQPRGGAPGRGVGRLSRGVCGDRLA